MNEFFLYYSRPTFELTADLLEQMSHDFSSRNRRNGVTGMLKVYRGMFYQYVEGPAEACDDLSEALRRDKRHRGLRFVLSGATLSRRFNCWLMDYRDFAPVIQKPGKIGFKKRRQMPLYLRNAEEILIELQRQFETPLSAFETYAESKPEWRNSTARQAFAAS